MPGTIAVTITDNSAKISPLIKMKGMARIIHGESTRPKRAITDIMIDP